MATTEKRHDNVEKAYKGSRRQIQFYVNEAQAELDRAIEQAIGCSLDLRWVSPLREDCYREYRDLKFLNALGQSRYGGDLKQFWPQGGPRWDALACVQSGNGGVLLVEAKSHVPEMYASGCTATAHPSLRTIELSLARTKQWLGVDPAASWMYQADFRKEKGSLYQMANRIAHLYFFRQVLHVDAWLVNVYFDSDPHMPTSREDWKLGLEKAKRSMQIVGVPYMADVFLPAQEEV